MGFDVVYLPPIHPIGTINRKGPNNTLVAGPDDVGSPWAIGSADGGHDAIHPELGTLVDFKAFVDRAAELDLEVALDLAIQCAPDHPWVAEHPEWFTTKPDGTIAYAENPPKKYQDIYPVNFDNDETGLYAELLRVVQLLDRARRAASSASTTRTPSRRLLALADLEGQADPPGRAVPRRGVHPARPALRPGAGSASPSPTRTSPGAPPRRS